jgi:hypothetical protein
MKGFIAISLVFAALSAGCGLTRITVTVEEQTTLEGATLPEQLLGNLGFPGLANFDITESRTFQNEGYTENDIDQVFTKSFVLRVVEPSEQDFDFLNSIRFTARAEGLPDLDIAWLDPIPSGVSEIELEVDADADLQPYVVAPEMTIDTTANGNRPRQTTTIEAAIDFEVHIKVF